MSDKVEARQAEIDRVRSAVDGMAKLMNGRFELDESKIQAFAANQKTEQPPD
jgi:hypothetical protein